MVIEKANNSIACEGLVYFVVWLEIKLAIIAVFTMQEYVTQKVELYAGNFASIIPSFVNHSHAYLLLQFVNGLEFVRMW
jgi:hypothetical protein